jgi:hypothetical protein
LADPRPPNEDREQRERELREREQRERESGNVEEEVRSTIVSPWDRDGESRRPALRRTMRQRRSSEPEVPKPPPLPDWFLNSNVELVADEGGKAEGGERQMRCVDKETGHVLFCVPYYSGETAEGAGKDEGKDPKSEGKVGIPGLGMFDMNPDVLEGKPPGNGSNSAADADKGLGFNIGPDDSNTGLEYDPLTWTLLETEAQARATLSMSGEAGVSTSFAASRGDIHLHCPDDYAHKHLDQYVRRLASILEADLIRLDANDIADLTSDYVGENKDSPGSFASLSYDAFDGHVAGGRKLRDGLSKSDPLELGEKDDMEDEEDDVDESSESRDLGHFGSLEELRKALSDRRSELGKMLGGMGGSPKISVIPMGMGLGSFPGTRMGSDSSKSRHSMSNYASWDDGRLTAAVESMLNAASTKRGAASSSGLLKAFDKAAWTRNPSNESNAWPAKAGTALVDLLGKIGRPEDKSSLSFNFEPQEAAPQSTRGGDPVRRRTIVHLRDLKSILNAQSNLGFAITKRLVESVQKRRQLGEEILLIGTSARSVEGPLEGLLDHHDDALFRLTILPPLFDMDKSSLSFNFEPQEAAPQSTRLLATIMKTLLLSMPSHSRRN